MTSFKERFRGKICVVGRDGAHISSATGEVSLPPSAPPSRARSTPTQPGGSIPPPPSQASGQQQQQQQPPHPGPLRHTPASVQHPPHVGGHTQPPPQPQQQQQQTQPQPRRSLQNGHPPIPGSPVPQVPHAAVPGVYTADPMWLQQSFLATQQQLLALQQQLGVQPSLPMPFPMPAMMQYPQQVVYHTGAPLPGQPAPAPAPAPAPTAVGGRVPAAGRRVRPSQRPAVSPPAVPPQSAVSPPHGGVPNGVPDGALSPGYHVPQDEALTTPSYYSSPQPSHGLSPAAGPPDPAAAPKYGRRAHREAAVAGPAGGALRRPRPRSMPPHAEERRQHVREPTSAPARPCSGDRGPTSDGTSDSYRPYTLAEYRKLQPPGRLGGLGADDSKEKQQQRDQRQRAKDYAQGVVAASAPRKVQPQPLRRELTKDQKAAAERRQRALVFAGAVPRPRGRLPPRKTAADEDGEFDTSAVHRKLAVAASSPLPPTPETADDWP